MYIVAPHSKFGQTLRKPFIKFICHSASYFTFLCEYPLHTVKPSYHSRLGDCCATDWVMWGSVSIRGQSSFFFRNPKTVSGAHPAFYSVGSGAYFFEGKVVKRWNSPFTFSWWRD
jgi:hypothetical protein